ncbi:DNA-methyltransferase [Propionivibrio sp.]|uniref:DNA-methyltransferase n=1 Tax=Propionivibrio sp. TaxID=2212460 RepID=UPI003BEF859F
MIAADYAQDARAVVYAGDCLALMKDVPVESIQLVVTSPPYNIGKPYEKKLSLKDYVAQQSEIIESCVKVLAPSGSICWQVGNFVDKGQIIPLDIVLYPIFQQLGLQLRNRIVWHFEHGLHCSNRFSGRYETVLWFTKTQDYKFNLDPVRVPQKYPGKRHFKGPKSGELSGNPLGKNPGDVWIIPNVKSNHVEKTAHPCQFPVELVERFVLALTDEDDWVFDPFLGSGTSVIAALRQGRRGMGAELAADYVKISQDRVHEQLAGRLVTRPMHKPVFDPELAGRSLSTNHWKTPEVVSQQLKLVQERALYDTVIHEDR